MFSLKSGLTVTVPNLLGSFAILQKLCPSFFQHPHTTHFLENNIYSTSSYIITLVSNSNEVTIPLAAYRVVRLYDFSCSFWTISPCNLVVTIATLCRLCLFIHQNPIRCSLYPNSPNVAFAREASGLAVTPVDYDIPLGQLAYDACLQELVLHSYTSSYSRMYGRYPRISIPMLYVAQRYTFFLHSSHATRFPGCQCG